MGGIGSAQTVKTKKDIRLEKAAFKEFKRGVKRGCKLTPEDLPQFDRRYFQQHDIISHPVKYPHGWMVSFVIMHPRDACASSPMALEDVKSTIGEAHQVGFAMARAILSGHHRERLHDFTESERDEIHRFCEEMKRKQERSNGR